MHLLINLDENINTSNNNLLSHNINVIVQYFTKYINQYQVN